MTRNKHFRSVFAALLCAVLCMMAFATVAYADGGDYYDDELPPETWQEETQPEDTTIVPGTPFTEDGIAATRDLLYDKHTNKQFITVETRNGHTLYIVIDYDKLLDAEEERYQTYFLNPVDEADLMALLEDDSQNTPVVCSCTEKCTAGKVNTNCTLCKTDMTNCAGKEATPEIWRVINSAKVSDHHAIIPTAAFAGNGFNGLPESEKKLMSLVCCKLLCAVAAPQEYETVTAIFDCGDKPFTAKGKTILIAGWKDIDTRFRAALKAKPDEDSAEDAALPELAEGQIFEAVTASVSEHNTTPPRIFISVLLPAPFSPSSAQISPPRSEKSTDFNTSFAPKDFTIPRMERFICSHPFSKSSV